MPNVYLILGGKPRNVRHLAITPTFFKASTVAIVYRATIGARTICTKADPEIYSTAGLIDVSWCATL